MMSQLINEYSIQQKIQYQQSTMPRVHNSAKQKNKKFKGTKPHKVAKITSTKTKRISKIKNSRVKTNKNQMVQDIKNRKANQIQKLTSANQYLDTNAKSFIADKLKQEPEIKIVLLLPCNQDADTDAIAKAIYQNIDKENFVVKTQMNACNSFSGFQMYPIANKGIIKNRIFFISPKRDLQQLIDLAKCADIICPVLSCKSTNIQGMNLNPYEQGKAFDSTGYTILNLLKSLGLPDSIGLIQHLEVHEQKHKEKVAKLFRRFLTSELGNDEKILALQSKEDLGKFLRQIDSINVRPQPWKSNRGYMMVDQISQGENDTVIFEGFLKGNCVHANQLVHVTGFDDYEIEKIEIKQITKNHRVKKNQMAIEQATNLSQFSSKSDEMYQFSKAEELQQDLLTALEGIRLQSEAQKKEQIEIQENEDDYEDIDDEELGEENMNEAEIEEAFFGNKQDEKAKRIELQMRKEDQLEFEDEIEYTADEILREKFKSYLGLKNFKTSQWNHLENLPDQYDRIFTFKHYGKTMHNVLKDNISQGFAYNGFYIAVTVKKFPVQNLQKHLERYPLIVTFLLKHERKMTTLHGKVRRNPFYENPQTSIASNETLMISVGFKRLYVKPIFSRCINGTDKTKYTKQIKQDYDSYFYCSFYQNNYFAPSPVLIYKVNPLNLNQVEATPIMQGELVKCDPMHIILERIILTGYPYKINKRRSTVRFMFFNPKDVKFYKPIQVRTKMGLRGRIQESLGTHGLMKCMFSDKIKHNDTVCMYLYRRVYPTPNF